MDRSIELNLSLKRFTSRIHVVLRQERIKPNRVLYRKLRVKWTCVAQSDICRFRTRRFSISKLAVENKNLYRGLLIKSVKTANGISVLSFARAKSILCACPTIGFWIRDPVNRCCTSSSLTTGWCRGTTEIITIVHDDLELASDIVTVVYELKSMNQISSFAIVSVDYELKSTNQIIWHCLCRSQTRINESNTLILQRHRHCRSRTQSNEPFLSSVTGVFLPVVFGRRRCPPSLHTNFCRRHLHGLVLNSTPRRAGLLSPVIVATYLCLDSANSRSSSKIKWTFGPRNLWTLFIWRCFHCC